MSYEYILFDLDGTLIDPFEGITKSAQYALKSFGIEVDTNELKKFIGPPLRDSFKRYYGFSAEEAELATAKYREYFAPTGIYQNKPYDGIAEMLESLKDRKLILATSKVTVYAEKILKLLGFSGYFSFIAGSEFDGTRGEKGEVIAYALDAMGVKNPCHAIMVGDREYDIIGAKENSIASVGVLYGYGNLTELQNAGADHIAGNVSELSELLRSL